MLVYLVLSIYQVDEERQRISLGMKASYLADGLSIQLKGQDVDEATNDNDSVEEDDLSGRSDSDDEYEIDPLALIPAESKAAIPALDVTLDDIDEPSVDTLDVLAQTDGDEMVGLDEKSRKQAKRKAKEEK